MKVFNPLKLKSKDPFKDIYNAFLQKKYGNQFNEFVAQNKPFLYSIKEIGVFGSYIRKKEKPESDLDILVEFSKPIDIFKFMELERFLSEELNIKVDLVSKKALKPFIGREILKEVVYV